MAKKPTDGPPNPHSVANRDILQRLNYLYHASTLLGTSSVLPPPPPSPSQTPLPKELHGKERRLEASRRNRARHGTAPAELARAYVRGMRAIGQKTNVRMDPAVKRTLCKGCDTVLVPGLTAQVRVNPSANSGNLVTHTCLSCRKQRRLPAPPLVDEADAAPSAPEAEAGSADAMAVDAPDDVVRASRKPAGRSWRKCKQAPRLPPLFERNVGHVVFRGNERIA